MTSDYEGMRNLNPNLFEHGSWPSCRELALSNAIRGIFSCDILFAWIESADCHGTLVEIGFAKALKKKVFIAWPKRIDALWFAREMDSFEDHPDRFDSPVDAFENMLAFDMKGVV